jgi:hypothetical protein
MDYSRIPGLNRIAKAINMTSKRTKAMVIACLIAIAWLFSLCRSSSAFIPLLASIGGVFVLLGLSFEKEADEKNEKYKPPFAAPYKLLEEIGWWVLMAGIGVEIVCGFFVARWDASQAYKNNALNQLATSESAILSLWTRGTNANNVVSTYDQKVLWPMSSKLAFGYPELMKKGALNLFSPVPSLQSGLDGTNIRWELKFERNDFNFVDNKVTTKVGDALNWRKFEIDVPFFRPGTKILKVRINLTINNSSTNLAFADEEVQNASSNNLHAFWDNLTNGVAIFNQTNGYSLFGR